MDEAHGCLGHGEVLPGTWERVVQVIGDNWSVGVRVVAEPYQPGERVGVAPSDYAQDETVGELVSLDKDRIVISRVLDSGQVIYLHFPRKGFELRRLQ